ncbi:MAG: T9SS type A sorting domain-containing protein [Bacteroidales bacterium]|nr:T9SS type A sorting domain-containing protein [Bacteroidales bacterium]
MKKYFSLVASLIVCGVAWAGSSGSGDVANVQEDDLPYSAIVDEILSPVRSKVYTEADTVIVRVCNTGTENLTDIPVAFDCYGPDGYWSEMDLSYPVRDTIRETLLPNQCTVFRFSDLMVFPDEYWNVDDYFSIEAWAEVYSNSEDEIEIAYQDLYTLNGDEAYCIPNSLMVGYYNSYINIVGVNFGYLRTTTLPLGWNMGYGMINYGSYDASERILRFTPVMFVTRGMQDSLIVHVDNNDICWSGFSMWEGFDTVNPCKILVAIDYNRDGEFGNDEILCRTQFFGKRFSMPVTISQAADFGYMRMRILVIQGNDAEPEAEDMDPCMQIDRISAQDYLLFVEETPPPIDVSLNRIVSIESQIISDANQPVIVSISNHGEKVVETLSIHYQYQDRTIDSGTYVWHGRLEPGHSTLVTLPHHTFAYGTTSIDLDIAFHNPADIELWESISDSKWDNQFEVDNDYLHTVVQRFPTVRCPYFDDFEETGNGRWFAMYDPTLDYDGMNPVWTPYMDTSLINLDTGQRRAGYVWKTDILSWVTTVEPDWFSRGIHAFLYSPLIDISVARPDTLSFYLNKDIMTEAFVALEFLDANGQWRKVTRNYFSGQNADGYQRHAFDMKDESIQPYLGRITQFRFCYSTNFRNDLTIDGDGCSIDNFYLSHIAGDVDVAVYEVSTPHVPQRGKKIYPTVVITNLGTEIVSDVVVEYRANNGDTIRELHEGELFPGQTDTHYFLTPFVCDASFPESFSICANIVLLTDSVKNNDTLCADFTIAPPDDDLAVSEYVSPRSYAVTHDSAEIVVRLCNNGSYPVEAATAYFQFNGSLDTTSEIDFVALVGGDGLEGGQCYDYSIPGRYFITMGYTTLLTIVSMPGDVARANDTLESIFSGLAIAKDLAAREIVVNELADGSVSLRLCVENPGSQTLSDYVIGFYLDGNASSLYRQRITGHPVASHERIYLDFDTTLSPRLAAYDIVTAFVYIEDDIDRLNDTTTMLVPSMYDLAALKVLVDEDSRSGARVIIRIENQGNMTIPAGFILKASINGMDVVMTYEESIEPAQTIDVAFDSLISQNPSGVYAGWGCVSYGQDMNSENDTTTVVELKGATDGIANVEAESLWLGQNYPNPCREETTIPFYLPKPSQVLVSVMDASGRMVYSSKGNFVQGRQTYCVKTAAWAAGIYYYALQTAEGRRVMKMVVR